MSIDQLLENAVTVAGLPGAVVEISDGQESRFAAAGVADTATGRPRHRADRFRIGSITKTFVATALLRAAAGELDTPVARRLPELSADRAITVRQLLNHTSGLFNYTADQERLNGYPRLTPELLVRVATDRPPLFPPGAGWAYSNTNYVIAGMLVERITGRPAAEEIDRLLPLADTWLPVGDEHGVCGQHARHYTRMIDPDQTYDATEIDPALFGTAGAMISTTGDLVRFFRALLGGELLPLTEMTGTVPAVDWIPTGRYGLGLSSLDLPCGERVWGMGGATFGSWALAYGTRDGRRIVVAHVNGDWSAPMDVLTGLLHGAMCAH